MHKQVDHVIVGRAARFALLACLLAAALSTAPTRADESPDPAPPGEVPPAAASSDSSGIEIPGVAPVVPDSVAAF